MDGRILGIALMGLLAALFGTAPAFAQGAPHFQANTTTNAMMNLDRCPYYPSQAVCRSWGKGVSAMEHNGRNRG
jgi:hypothetical protein